MQDSETEQVHSNMEDVAAGSPKPQQ